MITLKIHDYTVDERQALREILSEGRIGLGLFLCAGHQYSQDGMFWLCGKCKYKELCRDLSANIRYLDEYDSPT